MSLKNKDIIIDDWAGNRLFVGPYDSKDVDTALNALRCSCDDGLTYECKNNPNGTKCGICDGTGYEGDFEVFWLDESDKNDCNVYEYINY